MLKRNIATHEPEPEPELELEVGSTLAQNEESWLPAVGLQARLQARAWLVEQGFDLLQVVAIERIWSNAGREFSVAQLQGRGVSSLRAELAAHWGPDLRLRATWLEGDDASKPTTEQLLLQAAESEVARLRTELERTLSSAASELAAAKAEIARLENALWTVTRSADALKSRAEATATAARVAAERQAEAVAEASRVAALEAAQAANAERKRLHARLREYARHAETDALRRAEEQALAIREAARASAEAELLQIGPEQAALAVVPAPEPPVENTLDADDVSRLAKAEAEAERLRRELLASKLNSSYNLVSMQVCSLSLHSVFTCRLSAKRKRDFRWGGAGGFSAGELHTRHYTRY